MLCFWPQQKNLQPINKHFGSQLSCSLHALQVKILFRSGFCLCFSRIWFTVRCLCIVNRRVFLWSSKVVQYSMQGKGYSIQKSNRSASEPRTRRLLSPKYFRKLGSLPWTAVIINRARWPFWLHYRCNILQRNKQFVTYFLPFSCEAE